MNIFIVYTSNHLINTKAIINQYALDNILIISLSPIVDRSLVESRNEYRYICWELKSFGNSFLGKFSKNRRIKEICNSLKKIINNSQGKINIYYTTVDNVVTNVLFFSFSKQFENLEFYCYEDGIANYYKNHKINQGNKIRQLIRKLMYLSFGIDYTNYNEPDVTGAQCKLVRGIYVTDPVNCSYPNKAIGFKRVQQVDGSLDPEVGFVIGQEILITNHGIYNYIESVKYILDKLTLFGCKKIYYKPHPTSVNAKNKNDLNKISNFLEGKVIMYDNPNSTSEDVFIGLHPLYTVTICSTSIYYISSIESHPKPMLYYCDKYIKTDITWFFKLKGVMQL